MTVGGGALGIQLAVLGPVELRYGGATVPITGPKQRVVLAALAVDAGRVVSAAALLEALWGDDPPDGAGHTLQQHVSAIRRQLQSAGVADPGGVVVTHRPGYLLQIDWHDGAAWDSARSEGAAALADGCGRDALEAFDTALGLWRGAAFDGVDDARIVAAAAARLEEQRIGVEEARCEALLATGAPAEAAADLERLVRRHPLREHAWGSLMLALYRAGRQADALAAFQAARQALVDGLGIEPGARLRDLETAILQQSPTLDRDPRPPSTPSGPDPMATFDASSLDERGRLELPDGQAVLLRTGTSLIGRDPAALVRLLDNRVSRTHATIDASDDGCVLRDVGSSNGTTVNGIATIEHQLVDGDVIGVGGLSLVFRQPNPLTR